METLEDKIKHGMDKFSGVENAPLAPIPEEYTKMDDTKIARVDDTIVEMKPMREPTISELAAQQKEEALMREAFDKYGIMKDALQNCLMQAQHMRANGAEAIEACKQIEQLIIGVMVQL